jgi:hypothetical protein
LEHNLKTWVKYFDDVTSDLKPFEVRIDDRHYQVGDTLILEEYSPTAEVYTGATVRKEVTYILGRNEDEKRFVPNGYIIMGLKPEACKKLEAANKEIERLNKEHVTLLDNASEMRKANHRH